MLERVVSEMTMTTPWKVGWSSEEEYRSSGAIQSSHLMRHVVKKRLVWWHLIVLSEQSQRFPMGRSKIYVDLIARWGMMSRPKTEAHVGARNKSVDGVVACEVPNGREHRR
jgi:hypothetical protein